jgi:nitronate monooxygenase
VLDRDPALGRALVELALARRAAALWFAFGDDLGRWIALARETAADGYRPLIFVQLSSPAEAVRTVKEWGADVIVAQGESAPSFLFPSLPSSLSHAPFSERTDAHIPSARTGIESGGHGSSSAPPLLTLVPAIIAALAAASQAHVPVLAAGGLARGPQLAAALTLGAAGGVLGTRFLLSPQSRYAPWQRARLRAARVGDTVRTMAFDWSRGTLGWPAGIDGRGLRNAAVDDLERGAGAEELAARFAAAAATGGDALEARTVTWAGQGIGLVDEVMDAGVSACCPGRARRLTVRRRTLCVSCTRKRYGVCEQRHRSLYRTRHIEQSSTLLSRKLPI